MPLSRPRGSVAPIGTFGSVAPSHPHVHALSTDGRLLARTGSGEVAFSPLDLTHALAQQIPDEG